MAQTTNLQNQLEVEEPKVVPKESLLSKYNLPLQFLEYDYIEQCKNGRELEKILHVLKSAEEGFFPHLIEFAEKRLEEIKPDSKLLRKVTSVLQKSEIDQSEWKHLSNDLAEWVHDVKKKDQELDEKKVDHTYSDCDVRAAKELPTAPADTNTKRIASTDYKSWDQYDPDTEILKIDIQDEKIKEEVLKREKQKPKNTKTVKFKEFATEIEAEFEANRERERGNECFKAGELQEALQHYSNSIKCKPLATSYTNRALVLYKLKKYTLSMEDCKQAIKLEPFNFKAHFRLAQNYEALQQFEEALLSVERSIEIDPNNQIAQKMASQLYKKSGQVAFKNTRFMIEDVETRVDTPAPVGNNNRKKVTKSILKKKEVIIPIPGTSKMPTPYYKVVNSNDPEVIKREKLKIHNRPCLLHITTIDIDSEDEYYINETNNKSFENIPMLSLTRDDTVNKKVGISINENTIDLKKDLKEEKDKTNSNSQYINEKIDVNKKGSSATLKEEVREKKGNADVKVQPNDKQVVLDIKENGNHLIQDLKEEKTVQKRRQEGFLQGNEQLNHNPNHADTTVNASNLGGGGEPCNTAQEFRTPTEEEINSSFTFTELWYSIRKDTSYNSHANILKLFNFNRIDTVIGYKLDDFVLSSIINCLHKHFMVPSEINKVHSALLNIIKIPRFNIAFMFLDESVKIRIRNLIEFLDQHGNSLPDHVKKAYL